MDKSKKHWLLFGLINVALLVTLAVVTKTFPFRAASVEQAQIGQETVQQPAAPAKDEAKVGDADANQDDAQKTADTKDADADSKEVDTAGKIEDKVPAFDILRVEKDGSLLAAGRAKPNAKVELVSPDGTVIAETKAGPSGDFVLLPDKPVKAGDHVFNLRSKDEKNESLVSEEAGIVHIPTDDKDEVLAMVTKEGAASRILVKPERFELDTDKAEEQKPEPATVEAAPESSASEPKVAHITPEVPATEVPAKQDAGKKPIVSVEAVEVEDGNIYVAGSAKSGSPVRVYIDNKKLGDTKGTSNNRFLLEKKFDLTPGEHSVRADVVGGEGGKVIARAEVPLVHEPQPKSVESENKPATAEVVVPAPASEAKKSPEIADQKNEEGSTVLTYMSEPQGVIRTGSSIIIKRRDNLWRISTRTYGKGYRYTTIFNANRDQIRDPDLIYPGQIFKLPEKATN